jgi:predicted small secreted protein
MLFSKKFMVTVGLLSAVVFVSTTSMQQAKTAEEKKFKNLKVLPKNISEHEMHEVMEEWEHALGVRCGFCHVRNEETKKMDWALDGKPEKEMAREMYRMTANINKKYFKAGKDSTGMIMDMGVNCNMCHKGTAHPEVKAAHVSRPPKPQSTPSAQQAGTPAKQ